MIGSRPDIAYAVSLISRYMEHPGVPHWNAVKHIFRYLKGTVNLGIQYGNVNLDLKKDRLILIL